MKFLSSDIKKVGAEPELSGRNFDVLPRGPLQAVYHRQQWQRRQRRQRQRGSAGRGSGAAPAAAPATLSFALSITPLTLRQEAASLSAFLALALSLLLRSFVSSCVLTCGAQLRPPLPSSTSSFLHFPSSPLSFALSIITLTLRSRITSLSCPPNFSSCIRPPSHWQSVPSCDECCSHGRIENMYTEYRRGFAGACTAPKLNNS